MNTKKICKAILFTVPALTVLACASGETDDKDESVSGQKDNNTSNEAKADKPKSDGKTRVGNWEILTKNPEFGEEFGMFKTVKLKVRNASVSDDEPWLAIRLTNKAGDLVTEFDCIGRTVEPGQATVLDCSSLEEYTDKWSDYEIKNAI